MNSLTTLMPLPFPLWEKKIMEDPAPYITVMVLIILLILIKIDYNE